MRKLSLPSLSQFLFLTHSPPCQGCPLPGGHAPVQSSGPTISAPRFPRWLVILVRVSSTFLHLALNLHSLVMSSYSSLGVFCLIAPPIRLFQSHCCPQSEIAWLKCLVSIASPSLSNPVSSNLQHEFCLVILLVTQAGCLVTLLCYFFVLFWFLSLDTPN